MTYYCEKKNTKNYFLSLTQDDVDNFCTMGWADGDRMIALLVNYSIDKLHMPPTLPFPVLIQLSEGSLYLPNGGSLTYFDSKKNSFVRKKLVQILHDNSARFGKDFFEIFQNLKENVKLNDYNGKWAPVIVLENNHYTFYAPIVK